MKTYQRIVLDEIPLSIIKQLVPTGLYGSTEEEVIEHIILRGLQEAVSHGFVRLQEHGESEDGPLEPDGLPACEDCHSGGDLTGHPDRRCEVCGRTGEIPF